MMRREKRELSKDVPALEGGVEYDMTDSIKSLQFRYFNGFVWSDEWNNRTTLPMAVQISLLFNNGSTYVTKVDIGR